jgi:hypothetical protein
MIILLLKFRGQLSDVVRRRPQCDKRTRVINRDTEAIGDKLPETSGNVLAPQAPGGSPGIRQVARQRISLPPETM